MASEKEQALESIKIMKRWLKRYQDQLSWVSIHTELESLEKIVEKLN